MTFPFPVNPAEMYFAVRSGRGGRAFRLLRITSQPRDRRAFLADVHSRSGAEDLGARLDDEAVGEALVTLLDTDFQEACQQAHWPNPES